MVKLRGREAYPFYFGAKPALLKAAADLRKNMTRSEIILWEQLKNKKLENVRFRRQHPIGVFVVDFFCYEAMLVVELDGEVHNDSYQKERDIERTRMLNDLGVCVIRFYNHEVDNNIDGVLKEIQNQLKG